MVTIVDTRSANEESELRVAEANKAADEARKRTAEIQQLTAWRRVTPVMRQLIVSHLSEIASTLNVHLEYQNADPEAYYFANELAQALIRSGVDKQISYGSNSLITPGIFGVLISTKDTVIANRLLEALSFAGISCTVNLLEPLALPKKQPPENLWLFVGPKPPPEFPTTPL
jgi:hypothetical protein